MNAHADMFIVVGYNEQNTPRGIYRSLDLGEKKVSSFLFTKTSANKRLLIMSSCFASVSDGIFTRKRVGYANPSSIN